jgi:hypothetical protein
MWQNQRYIGTVLDYSTHHIHMVDRSNTVIEPRNKEHSILQQHNSKSYLETISENSNITIDGSLYGDHQGYWILYKIERDDSVSYFSFQDDSTRKIKRINDEEHYKERLNKLEHNNEAKRIFS